MNHDPYPWFTNPCIKVFGPLVTEFGFSDPEVKQLGHERYVRFTKGTHMVSIGYEPGHLPIIELFYPTSAFQHRHIPDSEICSVEALDAFNKKFSKLCRAQKYREADNLVASEGKSLESNMELYLSTQFRVFREKCSKFLAGGVPPWAS